jgi:translation initiation factor 5
MAKMINIPRDVEDKFYRYTMPVLRAKVEGKGNGIKTVVENMGDIAKALDRPVEYPVKFFGFELGALTKVDVANNKYIVNGKHDAEALANTLDTFITKYVLCSKCRNPETDLKVKGEIITSRCRACGKTSNIDMSHKLSSYILKNPPVDKDKPQEKVAPADQKGKARGKGEAKQQVPARPAQPEEDEVEWSADTSAAAVEQRRRELLGNRDRLSQKDGEEGDDEDGKVKAAGLDIASGADPVAALAAFFGTDPNPEDCLNSVKAVASKLQWSETNMYKFVFAALYSPETIRKDFYKKTDILSLFVTSAKHQKIVLYCLEKQCEFDPKVIHHLPHILNGFFEESILDQETLTKWWKNPSTAVKNPKIAKEIKDKAKPFIDWLEATPDEEDSESI